jgi:hypothetical protein
MQSHDVSIDLEAPSLGSSAAAYGVINRPATTTSSARRFARLILLSFSNARLVRLASFIVDEVAFPSPDRAT